MGVEIKSRKYSCTDGAQMLLNCMLETLYSPRISLTIILSMRWKSSNSTLSLSTYVEADQDY